MSITNLLAQIENERQRLRDKADAMKRHELRHGKTAGGLRIGVSNIIGSYSMVQAEAMHRDGLIMECEFQAFKALWTWGNYRMSGEAERKQLDFIRKYGQAALTQRINKVRAACGWKPLNY